MNKIKIFALIAIVFIPAFISFSCKKKDECSAGTGGNLTIVAKLKHHGTLIPNDSLRPDTVWIKFNATDWANAPAGSNIQFIGEFPEDHVHLEGLKCGDYFLYASGYDASISDTVRGGRAFSTEQTSGEIDLDIAVTE